MPAASTTAPPISPTRLVEDPAAWTNARATERARRAAEVRSASTRRRLVDPTTCERDYTPAEMEFMQAIQDYKQSSGRKFPTWSEVLEVLRSLGYEKLDVTSEAGAAVAG